MVNGHRGHRGQIVTLTVDDIAGGCVTVHRHRTTVSIVTAMTSTPKTAHSSSVQVYNSYLLIILSVYERSAVDGRAWIVNISLGLLVCSFVKKDPLSVDVCNFSNCSGLQSMIHR